MLQEMTAAEFVEWQAYYEVRAMKLKQMRNAGRT